MTPSTDRSLALPYGVHELDPRVIATSEPDRRVRCYVQRCGEFLRPPSRAFKGDVCPQHGIRCHVSGKAGTYSYVDPRRNAIVSPQLFARHVVRSPFKFEAHRLGSERSEDTVTWNVFRTLYEQQFLAVIAAMMVGERHPEEPHLYLWGIAMEDLQLWPLLEQARHRFESNLPVNRPLTEPDIALHLPGRYLILIEAKLTSPNTFYVPGPRPNAHSLTPDELVNIYQFREAGITNPAAALSAKRVPHQLWRNTVFAEWMALQDHPRTKAYHVNLVRWLEERTIEDEFRSLLNPNRADRFQRVSWEAIHSRIAHVPRLNLLREYLRTKTVGLRKAFFMP